MTSKALKSSLRLFAFLVGILYWSVSAQKNVAIKFQRIWDERLFMEQALSLVNGNWLGDYWTNTLVKGPGYPLFLAANHFTGLPIGLAQSLLYFAAASYFAWVVMRLLRSPAAFAATLIALLLIPIFFERSMQRLLRDTFYAAMTLCYFAGLLDLTLLRVHRGRWPRAVFVGVVGGILWITREEGIWLLPATILPLAAVIWRERLSAFPEFAVLTVYWSVIVVAVGCTNYLVYDRFVVNEIKDSAFTSALSAIQRASYPDFQPYLPAPKPARLKLYKYSPTFAKLRPFFDPPSGEPSPWNYGCVYYKHTCGDIAGGWFIWALRDGASRLGAHKDAATAASFYRAIAEEIEAACSRQDLVCGYGLPPLFPYMNAAQIASIPGHILHSLKIVTMTIPMSFEPLDSEIHDRKAEVLLLLNYPTHVEKYPTTTFSVIGWYWRDRGDWFSVTGAGLIEPIIQTRFDSPDLVKHFSDPKADRHRFSLNAGCKEGLACSLNFKDTNGATLAIDPRNAVFPMWYTIGDGALFIDKIKSTAGNVRTARANLFETWIYVMERIQPLLSVLVILGFVGFIVVSAQVLWRREFTALFLALAVIWTAVFTRIALMAVIAAGAFPADRLMYLAPVIPLAVASGVMTLLAGISHWRQVRA